MVLLKDSEGNIILQIHEKQFPLGLDVTLTDQSVKQYEIRFSYVWDEERKFKDRTKIRGAVMIGRDNESGRI